MSNNTSSDNIKQQTQKKEVRLIDSNAAPLCDYNGSGPDGKPVFQTRNIDEWKERGLKLPKEQRLVNINGSKPCALCGVTVYYKKMPTFKKPLCADCKGEVDVYSEEVELNYELMPKKQQIDTKKEQPTKK